MAQLGLRFDRVALRLLSRLRTSVDAGAPESLAVLLALTAPIRLPGRTAVALEHEVAVLLQTGAAGAQRSAVLQGNRAELRLVERTLGRGYKLLGFVHNADVPAARVLDLAAHWLRSSA